MGLPSLNALRVFEAAARLSSFQAAAEELNLTPSAVSRHIRSLEETLGIVLFERGFRQVQLTERAVHYARLLTKAFTVIEDATDEISAYGPVRRRRVARVTLSINSVFMNLWLADRLQRFRAANSNVELEISIHDDAGKGGNPKADLRVMLEDEAVDDPAHTKLVSLILIPVCAPRLIKGAKALRRPADLAKHRLLHENTTGWWEEWIAKENVAGVDAKKGAIFHDPTLAIREAVNGGGVALADNIMAQDLLARGQLVAPFADCQRIESCYTLVQRPGTAGMAGVKLFRQWLLAEIRQHVRVMKLAEG